MNITTNLFTIFRIFRICTFTINWVECTRTQKAYFFESSFYSDWKHCLSFVFAEDALVHSSCCFRCWTTCYRCGRWRLGWKMLEDSFKINNCMITLHFTLLTLRLDTILLCAWALRAHRASHHQIFGHMGWGALSGMPYCKHHCSNEKKERKKQSELIIIRARQQLLPAYYQILDISDSCGRQDTR